MGNGCIPELPGVDWGAEGTTLSVLVAVLLAVQAAPERSAPFTGVKWDGDAPSVRVGGEWQALVSLDGIPAAKLVAAAKTEYGDRWQKRFSEDLVELLRKLGRAPQATVELELAKDGKTVKRSEAMTEANRNAARAYNREGDAAAPAAAEAPRPARAPRPLFDFESAKIVFKYAGAFEGAETFWSADHGQTRVLQRDKKVGAWDRRTTFLVDGSATTFDPDTKTAFTSKVRPADLDLSVSHATDEGLKLAGLLRKGEETIAGKPCVLYENVKGDSSWRSWRWKGIELKIEMKNVGGISYVKEAVSVDEGAALPAELLRVPEGYVRR
jgi:hypothetical protein